MKQSRIGVSTWIVSIVVLASSIGTNARSAVRSGFEIGANVSSLGYEHLDAIDFITSHWDPGWRTSVTGGVTLEFSMGRRASLLTGLRYVQQGHRVGFDFPGGAPFTGEFRIAQHYLAVPVLVGLRPLPSPRFFVAAGPEGAVLLNGKMFTDVTSPGGMSTSQSITKQLQRANLSADVETGLEFPMGRHSGVATVRYTQGLVDVQRKQDWGVAWKTRGVESLFGMRW